MLALRDLPNVLTVGRIVLVAPLVWLLLNGQHVAALVLAVISGVSDWLDGLLARTFRWQSRFGGVLDPLADKVLLTAVYAALTWLGHLPAWLFGLAVMRDVIIVAGGAVYHYRIEPFRAEPTRLSKFNTLCQILLMWAVMTSLAGLGTPAWLIEALIWLAAFTIASTLVQYVVVWGLRARFVVRSRHGEG